MRVFRGLFHKVRRALNTFIKCGPLKKALQAPSIQTLQHAHDTHISISKKEQTKERNGTKKTHMNSVKNSQQKVKGKSDLKQRQKAPFSLVFRCLRHDIWAF